MNDTINGIKLNIDNIIRISKDNLVNLQLKNVFYLFLVINHLVDVKQLFLLMKIRKNGILLMVLKLKV